MFIEVGVRGVAPRQGCNVLLRLRNLASLNELAKSGTRTSHPWRGAVPNSVPIYKHSTPDGVGAFFFTPSAGWGIPEEGPRERSRL